MSRTGLVGGNVSDTPDAQHHDINAAERLYALLVEPAMLLHGVLRNRSVEREDVLRVDIHMVEEAASELIDAARLGFRREREIFVGVEHHDVVEAESAFLVAAYEFLIDRCERHARSQSEHTELAFPLFGGDFCLYRVSNVLCTLVDGGEDVCLYLLHTRHFRAFHGVLRSIEFCRYFVEYDL